MVSPDGRWIVFRATLSRRPQIAIVSTSIRGGDEASWITAVAKTGWNVDKPRWSPSGDRIYFSVTAGGPLSLWSIGFDRARGQVAGEPRSNSSAPALPSTFCLTSASSISPWAAAASSSRSCARRAASGSPSACDDLRALWRNIPVEDVAVRLPRAIRL